MVPSRLLPSIPLGYPVWADRLQVLIMLLQVVPAIVLLLRMLKCLSRTSRVIPGRLTDKSIDIIRSWLSLLASSVSNICRLLNATGTGGLVPTFRPSGASVIKGISSARIGLGGKLMWSTSAPLLPSRTPMQRAIV